MLHVCAGCCCTRCGCAVPHDAWLCAVPHGCAVPTEDRKRRRTELMQGRHAGKGKGKSGKADADRGKGKDDKDFAPPAPCPPWRYWPIALPDRDRAMGVQEVGQGVARIEHAENRVPAPKAKHSTRTQRAAERARADARSWLTRVDQFNREMSDLQQALSDDSEGTSSSIEAGGGSGKLGARRGSRARGSASWSAGGSASAAQVKRKSSPLASSELPSSAS